MATFAVLGATSWGVTLAALLERNGHTVRMLVRTQEEADAVNSRRGIARVPELRLGPLVEAVTMDITVEVEGIIVAAPSQRLRASVEACSAARDVPVLSAAKGLEHGTHLRMTEVLQACGWPAEQTAALSGPNLAHEIARGLPAAADRKSVV